MWKSMVLFVVAASALVWGAACGTPAVDCATTPDFATCVAPIFDNSCAGGACHGASGTQAGLKLVGVTAAELVGKDAQGANAGKKWIVASTPDESLIYLKLQAEADRATAVLGGRMPLGGSLTDAELATVKLWISTGAK